MIGISSWRVPVCFQFCLSICITSLSIKPDEAESEETRPHPKLRTNDYPTEVSARPSRNATSLKLLARVGGAEP